jgi:hypothetical protein
MGIYITHKTETSVSYDIQVFGKIAFVLKITSKKVNGRKVPDESETFFIERRVVDPGAATAHKVEKAKRFLYFTPEYLELLWDDLAKGEPFYDTLGLVHEETSKIKGIAGLDKLNFYRLDGMDHSVWRAGEDTPTSTPIHVDCSVGINDMRYDLDAAEKILAKNPRVTNLKRIVMPYYLTDEYGYDRYALEFSFLFSQKQLNQLYKDHPKECHPGWLRDMLKGHDIDRFNFLRLKRAHKKDR